MSSNLDLLPVAALCRLLGVSKDALAARIHRGVNHPPLVRLNAIPGGRRYFRMADYEAWLVQCSKAGNAGS